MDTSAIRRIRISVITRTDRTEGGVSQEFNSVRALVSSYLRWVQREPEKAAFLLTMRRAEFMDEVEGELEALNHEIGKTLTEWTERYVRRGELPLANTDVFMALLFGPSRDFAGRWLRGKTSTSLRESADLLGEAAWNALRALARKSMS